jgi:hypothetical protein
VAPALLTTTRRLRVLVVGLLVVGAAEGVLAVIQAYEGVGVLNKLVSGAIPGFVTFGGVTYLRSTGTFMQAGVLAAFVFATTLVAAASVAFGDRTLRRGALGALVILTWAVVYTSSRALLATFVVAIAALVGWLLGTRRPALAAAGPAAIALGAALLFLVLPAIRDAIGGADAGRHRILAIEDGRVVEIETTIGSGSSAGGGFLRRAAGFGDEGGGEVSGIWRERVRPQLEIVTAQRLIGHGPGTMTLGTGYAHPEARLEGESQFAKAAWELGLPGLALFVWLLGAAALVALDALRRTTGDRRVVAGAAALLTLLLPAWLTLTFAYDNPIVGELYWLLLGCCSTWTGPAIAHEEDA